MLFLSRCCCEVNDASQTSRMQLECLLAARSAASPLDRNHTRRRVPSSAADAAAAAADDDGATKAMDAESVYLQPCWCLWS